MKIGVAISGCDIGGAAAFAALNEIEKQGYDIALYPVVQLRRYLRRCTL